MATTKKAKIDGMLPVKKWLSLPEAMFYLDMGQTNFLEIAAANELTVSAIGTKKYYQVKELDELLQKNIILG